MNRFRTAALAVALAAGTFAVTAGPAAAASGPNDAGTNCHGVYLSYLSTSGLAPGQLHQDYGISVKDTQSVADALCQ